MGDKNEDDFQVYDGWDLSGEDSANDDDASSFKNTARPDRPTSSSPSSRRRSSSSSRQTRKSSSSPVSLLVQKTRIREFLTPYLPPPVVRAIHRIDPQLEPWVGPEACVTLVGTLLVAWFVMGVVRMIFQSTNNSSRRAIADDDDDDQVLSFNKGASSTASTADNQYDATVLLCGPRNGGKTSLFYQLGLGVSDLLPTVTSIKANVAVSNCKPMTSKSDDKENENSSTPRIRYVDWPGHAPLSDPVLEKSVWNKASTTSSIKNANNNDDAPLLRVVLVLDATQPVAAAAETLYELWSRAAAAAQESQKRKTRQQGQQDLLCIFCACHKKDLAKAKNSMRIKIQMRTELQRILSVQKPSWWTTTTTDNNNIATADATLLDLNDLPYCKLHFASTSSSSSTLTNSQQQQQEPGMHELAIFCQTGQLPSKES